MASLLIIKSMLFANALKKSQKKKKKLKKTTSKKKVTIMCRICNEEKGIIPIFNNLVHPEIPEEIKNFSGIIMNKMENFSNSMCQTCLDLLNGCIMFRQMCHLSNEKMLSELSIKREDKTTRRSFERDKEFNGDSEDSFRVPTPIYSEDNSDMWCCSKCRKEFDNLGIYNRHIAKCTAEVPVVTKPPPGEKKKFLCDVCGKTAHSNAGLLVHMLTHENTFPFKCDECPYQGRTMDLLKVHKRSHLADKPFKCTLCPKATTTSSNLAKHMRHVHSTNRPFKCTYCEKAFSYQHDMKRHIKDIHLRQGTVECDVCFKKFNTKKILHGHRLKIHKIKSERQGRLPSYLQCQLEGQTENNVSGCEEPFTVLS